MEIRQDEKNYARLLDQLKRTVEGVLGYHSVNIWDVYGGLHRLQVVVAQILKHGFRFLKDNGEPDFWVFIQGLSWLQPKLAASPSFLGHHSSPIRSPLKIYDKAVMWLYRSIEYHTLSEKLSWLLSDQEHLVSCYTATAYLRQVQYSEAMLICLRAVEQRKLSLIAKIDPALYSKPPSNRKAHRRCLSYPESDITANQIRNECKSQPIDKADTKLEINDQKASKNKVRSTRWPFLKENIVNSVFKCNVEEQAAKNFIKERLLKKSFSSTDLYLMHYKEKSSLSSLSLSGTRRKSYSGSSCTQSEDCPPNETNFQLFSDLLKVRYDKLEDNVKQGPARVIEKYDSSDSLSISSVDTIKSRPNYKHKRRRSSFLKLPFRIWEESDDDRSVCSDDSKTLVFQHSISEPISLIRKKSFIEKGGNIALPMSIGNFPKPSPGQSIMSFLLSGVFTQTNAELDRENAHFNISEAMIAALEQVKCNQQLRVADEISEESDEEMYKFRKQLKQKHADEWFFSETTDTTATTDQSVNSLSSSVYSTSDSISTDMEDDEFTTDRSNLLSASNSGLSVSKLSMYDDGHNNSDARSDLSVSAESVAISLLRRFKENQLPSASDIEWLVSERDAPQRILPLPNCFSIADDQEETFSDNRLRGTSDWAPPRPQIIFTTHPSPVRRQLMEKQSYRCAGCGTKVAQKYASKFRYCEYLGRYFCTGCHSEQTAVIPGRVLSKWDFNKYQVSNFAYELLDQMVTDPLFNVIDLNPMLYHRARGLQNIRLLRVSLFYLKDFIFTCKFSGRSQEMMKSEPSYVYTDPDSYSLLDFIRVKNDKLHKTLSELLKICESHVNRCQLCQARGFMCEICGKKEIIFPWELNRVVRCSSCGSCHHIKCYTQKQACPKCIRINIRNDLRKIGSTNEDFS